MSTRSSRRSQPSASGRTPGPNASGRTPGPSVSGRNKPQTSGRRPNTSGRAPAPAAPPPSSASNRKSGRTSGRSPAALPPERPATSRGSKRMSAATANPTSSREARQSGRQSKRQLDVSSNYISQRQSAAKKNKQFGMVTAIIILIFLVGGALGLFALYWNKTRGIEVHQDQLLAFHDWVEHNHAKFKDLSEQVSKDLTTVWNDQVVDKPSTALTQQLDDKYKKYLLPDGAIYGWCKKSWTVKGKNYSTNCSVDNASQFLPQPAKADALDNGGMTIPNINGDITKSGTVSLFWDVDQKKPIAVLQLNLAPVPAKAVAGAAAAEAIPPTQFYLWFDCLPLTGDAKARLDALISHPSGQPDAPPDPQP